MYFDKHYNFADMKANGESNTTIMFIFLYGSIQWSRANGVTFGRALEDILAIEKQQTIVAAGQVQ